MFQVFAYNKLGAGPGSNIVGPLETPEASKYSLTIFSICFSKPLTVWMSIDIHSLL